MHTSSKSRLQIVDWEQAKQLGGGLYGRLFAFFHPDSSPITASFQMAGLSVSGRPSAVPLVSTQKSKAFPGVLFPTWNPRISGFGFIMPIADMFRPYTEATIRIIRPGFTGEMVVEVMLNGQSEPNEKVHIVRGLGQLKLIVRPGSYNLIAEGMSASFTVAEFEKVVLSADLGDRKIVDDQLTAPLTVHRFGLPFCGRLTVRLAVNEQEVGVETVVTTDEYGRAIAELPIAVAGKDTNVSLKLINAGNAMEMCQVAIRGAAQNERQAVTVSDFGGIRRLMAAIKFGDAATERAYSLWETVESSPIGTAPFRIKEVANGRIVLEVFDSVESLTVVLGNPANGRSYVHQWDGESTLMIIPMKWAVATMAAGLWTDQGPEEYICPMVGEKPETIFIEAPIEARPGKTIQVKLNQPSAPFARVGLSFIWEGLTRSKSLHNLGSLVMAQIASLSAFTQGKVTTQIEVSGGGGLVQASRGGTHNFGIEPTIEYLGATREMKGGFEGYTLESDQLFESALSLSIDGSGPDEETTALTDLVQNAPTSLVVFAGEVDLDQNGEAMVTVQMPDDCTGYRVEVVSVAGTNVVMNNAHVQVSKAISTTIQRCPPIQDGKVGVTHLHFAGVGQAALTVTHMGNPIHVKVGNEIHYPGDRVTLPCDGLIVTGPGLIGVELLGDNGERDEVYTLIENLREVSREVRSIHLLQKGETIKVDGKLIQIRMLPGINDPFKNLVTSLLAYGHACCDQTMKKMIAALVAALMGQPGAVEYLGVGHERMETMWLKRQGYQMYPEPPHHPDNYWGLKAAYSTRQFQQMALMMRGPQYKAIRDLALSQTEMANDVAQAYHLDAVDPNASVTWETLYRSASNNDVSWQNAINQGHDLIEPDGYDHAKPIPGYGAVSANTESAFLAMILLHAGRTEQALKVANWVFSQMTDSYTYHSPEDHLAVILLMQALKDAYLIADSSTSVKIDDATAPITVGEACKLDKIQSVTAVGGTVLVEVVKTVTEDLLRANQSISMTTTLSGDFKVGNTVTLTISQEEYEVGTLYTVILPGQAPQLMGGVLVHQRSVDPEGKTTVKLDLSITEKTIIDLDETIGEAEIIVIATHMFKLEPRTVRILPFTVSN